ncbi:MAG: xylulokinase, partial [Deltaproteobacteria bacterium]|nr:xylulokinase [Deltaproteobacteria bacterium]
MTILGVDVGTTGLKMAVFSVDNGTLTPMGSYSDTYEIRTYNNGLFSDIHPEKWQKAFAAGCQEM